MSMRYHYYRLEGLAARVSTGPDGVEQGEIYQPGTGFVPGPALTLALEGVPITRAAFDALVEKTTHGDR